MARRSRSTEEEELLLQLVSAPLTGLLGEGRVEEILAPVRVGVAVAKPFLNLVEAEVQAAIEAAEAAEARAIELESRNRAVSVELEALVARETERWSVIGGELAGLSEDADPEALARDLGMSAPLTSRDEFREFMSDGDTVFDLGAAKADATRERRLLNQIAKEMPDGPLSSGEVEGLLASPGLPTELPADPAIGQCLSTTSGDFVLLGTGGAVGVGRDGPELVCEVPDGEEVRFARWWTRQPPVLRGSARAAFASIVASRGPAKDTKADELCASIAVDLPISSTRARRWSVRRLAQLARQARSSGKNPEAAAAALLALAYEIFRVAVMAEPPRKTASDQEHSAIEVGRVRWDELGQLPVVWLPLLEEDPEQVGIRDHPWTLDRLTEHPRWHAQCPTLQLDPEWFARVVVVPGEAELWALDPTGRWWSLEQTFDRLLDSRRSHMKAWLRAACELDQHVPAEVEALSARARARADAERKSGGEESNQSSSRFSRSWIEERAGRYEYQDDNRPIAAGAAAAKRGWYSRAEFLVVVGWKAARALPLAEQNSDVAIRGATKLAFEADDELARMAALVQLSGVGVPIASALLHFAFPDAYPILDWRALASLGDERRRTQYSKSEWVDYLERCRVLADKAGVSIRALDKALWQDSRESTRKTGSSRHARAEGE